MFCHVDDILVGPRDRFRSRTPGGRVVAHCAYEWGSAIRWFRMSARSEPLPICIQRCAPLTTCVPSHGGQAPIRNRVEMCAWGQGGTLVG
jgi:hypothetical protein